MQTRSHHSSRSYARAFTLIEMLLVVSIIVLLISLLLPSLQKSRETAREVLCRANMNQVTRAAMAYASDNAGGFPANRHQPNLAIANQHVTWRWLLRKGGYATDGGLWLCPNAPEVLTEMNRSIHGSTCVGDFFSNYAYNGAGFWRFSPMGAPDSSHLNRYGMPNGKSQLTLRNIVSPESTMLLLESRGYWPDIGDWALPWDTWPDGGGPVGHWHRVGSNWGMADGSVRWSLVYDTGNPDCWWHITPEPSNAHLNWQSMLPAVYKLP
ncbi:MAG: prepilin-type N-terminal cleavage/methylation domain-containing protein [Phycisphaeraceae bacterium]